MMKSNKLTSAVACALALTLPALASADPLEQLHKEEKKIHRAAVKSQERVNRIYEQSLDLLAQYRTVVDETDNLRVYNNHVKRLVDDQEASIASLQRQIDGIENTKQGVVPLMYKMLDALEKFIELDVPVKLEERQQRLANIRERMSNSNITTSERYRQVLEAYQIENDYGTLIAAYQSEVDGKVVDVAHIGRVALVAQALDGKTSWTWDNTARQWVEVGEEYAKPIKHTIRMARKQVAPGLIKLPVYAAESAL